VIRLRTLGAPDLRGEEAAELRAILTQPRLLALLVYLALARPRTFHRRDTLLALFWPEVGTEQARNALRQAVHRLRRTMGERVLEGRGVEELGLDRARFWCDVEAFERALDAGELEEALGLYRGDLLPGFHVNDAPEFERWLESERDRLRQRAVAAAWTLADREVAAGRSGTASQWARLAAGLTPDDEEPLRRLIRILATVGDRGAAIRAFEAFARRRAEDFETEPESETRALVEALRLAAPEAARPPSPTGEPVRADGRPAPAVPTGPVARSRSWRRAALPGAIVVMAGAAAVLALRSRPDAPPARVRTVAVFPFAIRGSPELAYLREAMVDLMSAKLDGAAGFVAIDPRSVIGAAVNDAGLATLEAGARLAQRLGASLYIRGDVVEIAGRLEISGALYDPDAGPRPLATASVSGETTSLFELVDALTGRMLSEVAPGRDTTLTRLAALTTQSLPALTAFLEGERLLRAGLDGQAATAFREAVALDSTFALAQYRLAIVATWVTVPGAEDPIVWAAAAARHAGRLSPLIRDLLTAYRAYRAFDGADAERRYRDITEGYPDNVEAWLMLGETLFHFGPFRGRSPAEAWPAFRRVLALEPGNPHAMVHLARLAAREGRVAVLDSLVEGYLGRHRDAERAVEMRGLRAYVEADTVESTAVAALAAEAGEFTVGSLLQAATSYAQRPEAARGLLPAFGRSVRSANQVLAGRRQFTDLALMGGQWGADTSPGLGPWSDPDWLLETRALVASDPFFGVERAQVGPVRDSLAARPGYAGLRTSIGAPGDLGPEMRVYLLGLLSVRLGDTAAAGRAVALLRATSDPDRAALAAGLSLGVLAELARARGDLAGALRALDGFPFTLEARLSHWGIRERFLMAELLRALGRHAEALPWYDSFGVTWDLPWVAPAHFRSGEIQERLGNPERAAFHYARALDLWKACDPGLRPYVTQAEQALARLSGG